MDAAFYIMDWIRGYKTVVQTHAQDSRKNMIWDSLQQQLTAFSRNYSCKGMVVIIFWYLVYENKLMIKFSPEAYSKPRQTS